MRITCYSSSSILASIGIVFIFLILSISYANAAETNISEFNDFKLRDNESNYTWSDWIVEDSDVYKPIDGKPTVKHYKFFDKLKIDSQLVEVNYSVYSHDEEILEIDMFSTLRLDQDDSELAIEAGTEKYMTAFCDLLDMLNEKYDDTLFYGLDDSGPCYINDPVEGLYEHGIDVEWYNRTFSAYWEDSELDNIELSMEMTYMKIGSQESLSIDLRLEYRAEKEWDRINGYDTLPDSGHNDVRDKL